jgi:hypothetical protein
MLASTTFWQALNYGLHGRDGWRCDAGPQKSGEELISVQEYNKRAGMSTYGKYRRSKWGLLGVLAARIAYGLFIQLPEPSFYHTWADVWAAWWAAR